jgi:hypothetical protein
MEDGGPGGAGGSIDVDASDDATDAGGAGGAGGSDGEGGAAGSSGSAGSSGAGGDVDGGTDAGRDDAPAGCGTPWESGHTYALHDEASRICSDTANGANNCTVGMTYVWQCVYVPLCSSIAPGTSDSYAVWQVVRLCN